MTPFTTMDWGEFFAGLGAGIAAGIILWIIGAALIRFILRGADR